MSWGVIFARRSSFFLRETGAKYRPSVRRKVKISRAVGLKDIMKFGTLAHRRKPTRGVQPGTPQILLHEDLIRISDKDRARIRTVYPNERQIGWQSAFRLPSRSRKA